MSHNCGKLQNPGNSHSSKNYTEKCRSYSQFSYRGHPQSVYHQTQVQYQLQRSVEASKQMLYGVYGNLIAQLEEFEIMELTQKGIRVSQRYKRSNIDTPRQKHNQFEDVKSKVETLILLFEKQSNACPQNVRYALLEELKRKTLEWTAVRADMVLPDNQDTDYFISKVYEILATGRTEYNVPSRQYVPTTVLRQGFQSILYGDHERQMLDQSFKENPNKKAKAPDTRKGEMLDEAARRIMNANGKTDLNRSLLDEVRRIKQYGPLDLK